MQQSGKITIAAIMAAGLIVSLAGCDNKETLAAPVIKTPTHSQMPGRLQLQPASLSMLQIQEVSDTEDMQTAWAPAHVAFRDDKVTAVSSPVQSRIVAIHANVGDLVRAGTPLVTLASLDALRIRYESSKAKVAHDVAQTEARRQQIMSERGVGTEVELLAAQARLNETAQELERAQRTASLLGQGGNDRVVLTAPRDGVVAARNATTGATVDVGSDPLFMIGDPGAIWVVAEVFESDLAGMRVGTEALVEMSSMSQPMRGKVQRMGATLNAETRRAPVFITLDAGSLGLRPGMLARAGLKVPGLSGLSIPLSAVLIKDEKRSIVYVQLEETVFEARDVTLGPPSRDSITVIKGLQAGDRIVVKGGLLLDGAASQLL